MTFTYDASAYRTYVEREFTYLAGFRRNTHRYARRTAMTDIARKWRIVSSNRFFTRC